MQKWPDAQMIRYFGIANSESILVTGLDAMKEVLEEKTYAFVKPGFMKRLLGDVMGEGLLFAEGDEHVKQAELLRCKGITSNPRLWLAMLIGPDFSSFFDGKLEEPDSCLQEGGRGTGRVL